MEEIMKEKSEIVFMAKEISAKICYDFFEAYDYMVGKK